MTEKQIAVLICSAVLVVYFAVLGIKFIKWKRGKKNTKQEEKDDD